MVLPFLFPIVNRYPTLKCALNLCVCHWVWQRNVMQEYYDAINTPE